MGKQAGHNIFAHSRKASRPSSEVFACEDILSSLTSEKNRSNTISCLFKVVAIKYCRDNRGIALVTSLLFTLICLGMILTVLFFVAQGTRVSNLQKRYQTALEASFGGAEFVVREVIPKTILGADLSSLGTYAGFVSYHATDSCFNDKLAKLTASWSAGCSSSMDSKNQPDMKFTLAGAQGRNAFDVYAKIVDTKPGNSSTSGVELEGIGVVESNSGILTPPHFPYTYRIEMQGERQTNPDERANLSAFYEY